MVELVSVIVLVSILSAFLVPKMSGTAALDEYIVRDQLISAIRFTQQHAMSDLAAGRCYRISTTAHDYIVERSIDSGVSFNRLDVSYGDANLRQGDASVTTALSKVTLPVMNQRFDGLGNPVAACGGANSGNREISVVGSRTTPLCIYSTGYVRAGNCP